MHFYDYLTDFIFVEDKPEQADAIFIPGGPYGEIAVHASDLYHQGFSNVLIPSGKYSILNGAYTGALSPAQYQGQIFDTEADFFSAVLLDNQVPKEVIYPEREATFTYENAIYTKALTDSMNLSVQTAILSCQAYHARRCLLYYQAVFPSTRFLVCPTPTQGISRDNWFQDPRSIDMVLGEVERCGSQFHEILKKYPAYTVSLRKK